MVKDGRYFVIREVCPAASLRRSFVVEAMMQFVKGSLTVILTKLSILDSLAICMCECMCMHACTYVCVYTHTHIFLSFK